MSLFVANLTLPTRDRRDGLPCACGMRLANGGLVHSIDHFID